MGTRLRYVTTRETLNPDNTRLADFIVAIPVTMTRTY